MTTQGDTVSTTARKARKRAGIAYTPKPSKIDRVGTPIQERAWFNATFPGVKGTRYAGVLREHSIGKRLKALADRVLIEKSETTTNTKESA
jgi:hypothetical protein